MGWKKWANNLVPKQSSSCTFWIFHVGDM